MTKSDDRKDAIRVLLADDHPPILEGLSTGLRREGIEVVAHATAPEGVLAQFTQLAPHVLVLDIRYGRDAITGLDVARQVLDRHPDARIVVYTQFDTDELAREAYRIGCLAFVTKSEATATLAAAIKSARAAKTYFLPAIVERLAMLGVRGDASPIGKLDSRELSVFRLMAKGRTNAEMGEALSLSPRTISVISQAVKDKLGVSRQAELTLLAVRCKVIDL